MACEWLPGLLDALLHMECQNLLRALLLNLQYEAFLSCRAEDFLASVLPLIALRQSVPAYRQKNENNCSPIARRSVNTAAEESWMAGTPNPSWGLRLALITCFLQLGDAQSSEGTASCM